MKKDFNRLIKALDANELREELQILYGRFAVVREYYKLELGESTRPVVEKYRKELRKSFFTAHRRVNRRGRSASKRVLKAFAEVSIHPRDLVELYFYRAEVMTDAIIHYKIDNESFLIATAKAFEEALVLAEKELLLQDLQGPIYQLMVHYNDQTPQQYSVWPVYQRYFPT